MDNPHLSWKLGTRKYRTVLSTAETVCAEVKISVWHLRLRDLNEPAKDLGVVRSLMG